MKKRSLQSQFIFAINESTRYGESKRSGRNDPANDYKIYSRNYHDDLIDTAKNIAGFIRDRYPDVKLIRDIKPIYLTEFLASKADICSIESIKKYKSHIVKLEKICCHRFGKIDWTAEKVDFPAYRPTDFDREKIRDRVATDFDYSRILSIMKESRSESWKILPLARYGGLRINEAANVKIERFSFTGGRWGCGSITLKGKDDGCKGGRPRRVDILTPEGRKALQEAVKGLQSGYVISKADGLPFKSKSLEKALERAISKAEIDWKRGNGLHSFRKAFAQECYDTVRSYGGSKNDAAGYSNQQLGHGSDRSDLTKTYVGNLW